MPQCLLTRQCPRNSNTCKPWPRPQPHGTSNIHGMGLHRDSRAAQQQHHRPLHTEGMPTHSAVFADARFKHAAPFRKYCTAQTNTGNGSHSPSPSPRSDPAGHKLLSAHLVHTAPAAATHSASTSAHAAALSLSANVSWTRPHLHTTNRQQRIHHHVPSTYNRPYH